MADTIGHNCEAAGKHSRGGSKEDEKAEFGKRRDVRRSPNIPGVAPRG